MPTVITTFSTEYYNKWGKECLSSLVKFWPGRIVAYYEDRRPTDFTEDVEYRSLHDQPDYLNFIDWTSKVPLLQGIMPDGDYQYHFDANKFVRKVYAITHFAREAEPFFFVGADTRCLKQVPEAFLNGLMDGYAGVFLLRRHIKFGNAYAHVESDFAGYDPRDDGMGKLLKIYREAYNNGSFLELPSWHDCVLLDRLLDTTGLIDRINNLSDGVAGEGKLGLHVWPNTILSEYMIHLKGGQKKGKGSS